MLTSGKGEVGPDGTSQHPQPTPGTRGAPVQAGEERANTVIGLSGERKTAPFW